MESNCIRCGRELKDPWSAKEGIGPICKRKIEAERLANRLSGKRIASYSIVDINETRVLIKDDGPWSLFPTITNSAAEVVTEMAPELKGRRLFYIDSEGRTDELFVVNGKFAGFNAIKSYKPELSLTEQELDADLDEELSEDEIDDILDEMNREYNRDIANSLKRGY